MKVISLCLDPNTDTCLTLRFTVEGKYIVLRNEEQGIGYTGKGGHAWPCFDVENARRQLKRHISLLCTVACEMGVRRFVFEIDEDCLPLVSFPRIEDFLEWMGGGA